MCVARNASVESMFTQQTTDRVCLLLSKNEMFLLFGFRLCVRNLPLNVDDKRLKEIFSTVAGRNAVVKKVLIIRSKDRVDSSGRGRSMGYGFVEFANHNDALAALRATNNNPDIFGADRRPIVEFSLENSLVVKVKQRRLDKARQRQQPDSEQPKTNKEKRLEKSQKRREKRQRKREANKERKLEDGKEGKEEKPDTGSKEGKAPNSDVKFQRKKSENSWKTKKGKRTSSAELPAPRNLGKTDRQKQRKFPPISSNVNKSYNEPAVAKANLPAAIQDNKKKKPLKGRGNIGKTFHERADSFTHTNAKNEVTNRKRKGARRKEQDKKDESNFTDMVNKYKNKLFGRDEGEVPAKRSRWFDD